MNVYLEMLLKDVEGTLQSQSCIYDRIPTKFLSDGSRKVIELNKQSLGMK
jgi:hypothetical protein